MRLEFTDRRGVEGVVHGEPWELEYDGMYRDQLEPAVENHREVTVRVPVEDDDLPSDVRINAHEDAEGPPDTRLRMLRSKWVYSPYITEMELILGE